MVTGVEFDEDNTNYGAMRSAPHSAGGAPASPSYRPAQYSARGSGMTGWLMAHGWVKSENAAQGILIVVVLINIAITYVVVKFFL